MLERECAWSCQRGQTEGNFRQRSKVYPAVRHSRGPAIGKSPYGDLEETVQYHGGGKAELENGSTANERRGGLRSKLSLVCASAAAADCEGAIRFELDLS